MGQRLLDAAKLGDVVELQNILKEDPLVLEEVSVIPFAQTPLHVAVEEVTAQDETVLHLAVKGNHFEALKVLIESIERLKELDGFNKLLCAKDKEGNTASELAEARKQAEGQDLLNEKGITSIENATISDITEEDGDATNEDKEIEKRLQFLSQNLVKNKTDMNMMSDSAASGKDTKIVIDPKPADDESKRQTSTVPTNQTRTLPETQERHTITSSTEGLSIEMKNVILIVATLLATVTYQAGLSPPRSIWQPGTELDTSCLFKKPHKYLFLPTSLRECPAANFYLFMIGNTAGFMTSLGLIFYSSPGHKVIRFAILLVLLILSQTYFNLIVSLSQDILSLFVLWILGPMIFVFFILSSAAMCNILYNRIKHLIQAS